MNRVHHGHSITSLGSALVISLFGRGDTMSEEGSSRGMRRTRARLVDDDEQSQAVIEDTSHRVHVIDSEESGDDDDVRPITRKRSRADLERVEDVSPPPDETPPPRDEDQEEHCTICFDSFTSNGSHRLVSLRCGHFFGEDCIKRWISSESGKACPTCKKSAKLKDLRNHFVAAVKAVDNSEAESLRQSLTAFQRENEGLRLENLSLKKQIEIMAKNMHANAANPAVQSVLTSFLLKRKHTFVLSKEEGSRAFDLNGEKIVVSLKLASSPISEGFGIAILDSTLRPMGEKVGMAARRIRTIEFSPADAALYLVGGEDTWLMVRSVDGGVRKRVSVPAPVWCACWTAPNKALVGLSNGRILELETDSMALNDVIQWEIKVGVTRIAKFDTHFAILIVGLKSIRVLRHGRITSHLQDEIGTSKVQDVSVLPSHNSFVLSLQAPEGSIHRLYRLHVDNDENVEVILVSTLTSPSKSFSYMWRNSLFHFGGALTSAIFQEDFKRVLVHDWSESREDRFLTMGTSSLTHLRAVSSSSTPDSCHIVALAEKELHLLQLMLTK